MVCKPLEIQPGLFYTNVYWENLERKTFGDKELTMDERGIIVRDQNNNTFFYPRGNNNILYYMMLGDRYLLILDIQDNLPTSTRTVWLVNFDNNPWDKVEILTVRAGSDIPLPQVNPSPGNAAVFLIYGQDGTYHTDVAIRRSDNGDVVCYLGDIIPTGQTLAEATESQLIIHYSINNTSRSRSCPLPTGKCQIIPSSLNFGDVPVGGCPITPPSRQFTIRNVGNDCLTVERITNIHPFRVLSTSSSLPAILAKNETVDVTVEFNPSEVGWYSEELEVITEPAWGNRALRCIGRGVEAQPQPNFNQMRFDFGTVPVGDEEVKTLTITNSGSAPLTVTVTPLNVSGFTCAGFNGTLNCGDSRSIDITFAPTSEGSHSATLTVTTNAASSPHNIQLEGDGCVDHAEIRVDWTGPIDFGQVEQGFRTVKFFEVRNTGNSQLAFTVTISGPDAHLFGLPKPDGSTTDAPRTRHYTVDPMRICSQGQIGTGKTLVPVSFFADQAPGMVRASLTLSGHNATNSPGQSWTFPLQAEITPPVVLDVGLVIDRSGSMSDSLGERIKIDAAISASQLFVELLRPGMGDRVNIVRFNQNPEVVIPISPVSESTQRDILRKIRRNVPPASGTTAIAGGTITSFKEIRSPRTTAPPQLRKTVVVLTDGIENTAFEDPPGSGQWYSILGGRMSKPNSTEDVDTTAMPIPSDIKVYAVGIGRSSDISPQQLTALSTNGEFFHVDRELTGRKYFQLEKYYTQIFMDISNVSQVVDPTYWIFPGEKHEIEFDVLRGDVKALIVMYDWRGERLPFYCLSPQGEIIDPAVVPAGYQIRSGATSEARFVEFKMPIKEPERYAGHWKVLIEHPGKVCSGNPRKKENKIGFIPGKCRKYTKPILYGIAIGVGSNFRMIPFVTPGPVYVGESIQLTALVSEAGLPVTDCDVKVEVSSPNGSNWVLQLLQDETANNGEYSRTFTHTYVPGTYHFRFRVVGKSRDEEPIVREAIRDKAVLPRTPPTESDDTDTIGEKCCKELLRKIRKQEHLLESVLRPKSGS